MTFLHLTDAGSGLTLDRTQKWSNLSLPDRKWEGAGLGAFIHVAFIISGEVKKMIHETFLRSSKAFTQRFCIGFGVVLLALAGLAGSTARAQLSGKGTISGTVSDSSGAALPNATVTATNVATNVKTTRKTTPEGYYVLSPLDPGIYTVAVTAPGFKTLTQDQVTVDALQMVGLNLSLQIGEVTEDVVVTAAPPALDTANAVLGNTVENTEYTALPLEMVGLNLSLQIGEVTEDVVV